MRVPPKGRARMIQCPFPPPPPGMPELPPLGPARQFLAYMTLVFWSVEMLIFVLPTNLQRKINQLRFGPGWKR